MFVYSNLSFKDLFFEFFFLSFCIALFLSTGLSFSFHHYLPPPNSSPLPAPLIPCTFLAASKSPARELVSQSALSVFDNSKCTDVEFRGNRTRVRDVTLAVVTISILRFEPPRIARWLRTGPWRKRHADTNENECRERSVYNANCREESITRNTGRDEIFVLYAAKSRYVPHCEMSREWFLDKTEHTIIAMEVEEWIKHLLYNNLLLNSKINLWWVMEIEIYESNTERTTGKKGFSSFSSAAHLFNI